MSVVVTTEIRSERVERGLASAIRAGSDLVPVWRLVNAFTQAVFRRQFETSGQYGGRPWAGLAESTKALRPKRPGGNKGGISRPLWDTAAAKRSLQTTGPDSILVMRRYEFQRGTRRKAFAVHQTGTTRAGKGRTVRIPARPLITPRVEDLVAKYAAREIGRYLKSAFEAA